MGVSLTLGWCTSVPAALAETRQIDYVLNSGGSLSYQALIQQANLVVEDLVQRSFAESSDIAEIYIRMMGEHNGSEAPLLYVMVSRSQWQSHADIHAQTRYFGRSSAVLLGLAPSQNAQAASIAPTFTSALNRPVAPISDIEPNFYQ